MPHSTLKRRNLLVVGMLPVEIEQLCAESNRFSWDIAHSTGCVHEFESIAKSRYHDVLVDIEGCTSYAPALLNYLAMRDCLEVDGMRVAVGQWFPAGFRKQLASAGFCTFVEFRAWRTTLREAFCKRFQNAA